MEVLYIFLETLSEIFKYKNLKELRKYQDEIIQLKEDIKREWEKGNDIIDLSIIDNYEHRLLLICNSIREFAKTKGQDAIDQFGCS